MPYVPGFTNDIFISFARANNWDGWVENFQKHLSHRLVELGADVTIWRDSKLRGTDVFSDEIFEQLQQSALLISIISPPGIKSRWCEDERQAFERFAALNGGFRFANTSRAINVVKTPLPADQHRQLFGTTGYEFYKRDPQSPHITEFDLTSPEFRQLGYKLAQDIKNALDEFSQYLKSARKKETIYVATTLPDLKPSRAAVVQQLEDWGYAVVPQSFEPPRRLRSFEAVTKAELAASIFSVHLASDRRGEPIVEEEKEKDSITGQYELAQSLRKDRIIWVEPGRELHSEFDIAIKQGMQNGMEILKDSAIEDLKDAILDKLKQKQNKPGQPPKSQARVELYMICDHDDRPSKDSLTGKRALCVQEYLDENGVAVIPPPFTRLDWTKLEEVYGEQLQLISAVLLYWGTASEDWFLKARQVIVKERMRRNKTSDAGTLTEAFYFFDPPLQKSQYRKLADFVFEQYKDFQPEELKPLVNRLRPNEEAQ